MTSPTDDLALVKDGVVQTVVRAAAPASVDAFGADPDGEIVAFDPDAEVCAGMMWDGETLSPPLPE